MYQAMLENRQAAHAPPLLALEAGFSTALDEAAVRAAPAQRFLTQAWFAAAGEAFGGDGASTFALRRRDGSILAAIPTIAAGPALLGARTVPGCYWPFRGFPADEHAYGELDAALSHRAARSALGPVWRLGPVQADDPLILALARAARHGGWHVLRRYLGVTFLLDLASLRAQGPWPRSSTAKRLRNYEKRLAKTGPLSWRTVRGADWHDDIFEAMATIEANSWIATRTDRSGAKFLNPANREFWEAAVRDPVLADMLSATLLHVGEVPVAFSFDLDCGPFRQAIAGSHDEAFNDFRPGKLLLYRSLAEAAERGIARVDLGAGDSGYKREIGAAAGSSVVDLLFVRNRALARVLRPRWQSGPAGSEDAGSGEERGRIPFESFLMAGLAAAAVAAGGE